MSFEVFIQCFDRGEPDGLPVADVKQAFGPQLQANEKDWWNLFYNKRNSCDILVSLLPSNPKLIHHLSVHRPCGDIRLWKSLFSILKMGHVVLYFPAEKPPLLVSDQSVAKHLPKDMIESMGPLILVSRAQDILDEISTS